MDATVRWITRRETALDAPPDLNGNIEENVQALIWTVFGDQKRNPGSGLIAQVQEIRRTLNRIYAAVIGILATGLVALITNVVVLLGK